MLSKIRTSSSIWNRSFRNSRYRRISWFAYRSKHRLFTIRRLCVPLDGTNLG